MWLKILLIFQCLAQDVNGSLTIKTTHEKSGATTTRQFCPTEEGFTVVSWEVFVLLQEIDDILQYTIVYDGILNFCLGVALWEGKRWSQEVLQESGNLSLRVIPDKNCAFWNVIYTFGDKYIGNISLASAAGWARMKLRNFELWPKHLISSPAVVEKYLYKIYSTTVYLHKDFQ